MRKKCIGIFAALILLASCASENSDLNELDLMSYGMPISIKAPEGAEVTKRNVLFQQELHIQSGEEFDILVTMGDAVSLDEARLKSERMKAVKDHRYFFRVVEDDERGFIYENRIDSLNTTFGFNYIQITGDKEFTFENSRSGMYDLEQIQKMYSAVRKAE